MKRLALLIALLLLTAPALAESLSVEDRYASCTIPESVVLMLVQTEEGAVYLVRNRDGSRHLEYWNAAGGTPVLSTTLPEGAVLGASRFGEPMVVFPHPAGGQLTVTLRRDGNSWRIHELTEDGGFSWMYAGGFLITEGTAAAAGQPGFDTDITRVDWLSLPGSYEDALTMLAPAGAQVCTNLDYWLGENTAMFLLQQPDGTTVLACSERTEDGGSPAGSNWRITCSSPLPEGTDRLDSYHAGEGSITIRLPQGDANVALQPDGRWLLTWACDVSIGENHLWFGMGGPYYADVLLERDMTRIDWVSLPVDYEDWLPLADASCWAVVTGAPAPLRGEDDSVIALYNPGTPLRLLEERDSEYRVAVAGGGNITGWMDASALLIGEAQIDPDGEEGFTVIEDGFVWGRNCVTAAEGAWLLDAPGGKPLREADFRLHVLAVHGDWLHVLDGTMADGFICAADCTDFQQWLAEYKEAYDLP